MVCTGWRRRAVVLGFVAAAFLVPASSPAAPAAQQAPSPHPTLGPDAVVRIQLEALRGNDARDTGIAVAFRFASPSNKRSTGPLPRFASMIKNGPYRLMLEYRNAAYNPVEVVDRVARQRVTLIGVQSSTTYVFYLSRQTSGPWADCWMTDAVFIEPFSGQQV